MNELGTLKLKTQFVDMGYIYYRQIIDAEWEGPPVTLVGEMIQCELPDWAIALDGELIQIGPYVLRRTGLHSFESRADYYYLVDSGLPYWLWWRTCQHLQFAWTRIILILAACGLSAWPKDGTVPSWADVMRRWQK